MGAKKDIHRVRELILGKDFQRFEERFTKLEERIETLTEEQKLFEKDILKSIRTIEHKVDKDNTNTRIELKTLKTEFKMYMKSKLNSIEHNKISHQDLAKMFASLSQELETIETTSKYAQK